MEFLIVTGLSGAGKSHAADVLEDLGYYCVDNMPVALMPKFAEFCLAASGRFDKVVLVTDVREKSGFGALLGTIDELVAMKCKCRILFMEADLKTLVRRYKETRRRHPLAKTGEQLEDAIMREMELLKPIREKADFIVNSTNQPLGRLQTKLSALFAEDRFKNGLEVTVMSFGYKHGIPLDADLVFDARFLPNPFYVEELRALCGLDRPVMEYVFSYQQTRTFMEKLEDMIEFLLPLYTEEGKQQLIIAIGCTGGRHRSVAIASALNAHLQAKKINCININRDVDKQ